MWGSFKLLTKCRLNHPMTVARSSRRRRAARLQRGTAHAGHASPQAVNEGDETTLRLALTAMRDGFNHHQAGRLADAEIAYRRALAAHPDFAEAYHALGVLLQQQGRCDDALGEFETACALKPSDTKSYYRQAEILMGARQYFPAAQALQQAINIDPGYVDAYEMLGRALFHLYRNDRAVEVYRAGLVHDPENAGLYHGLGLSQIVLGDRSGAAVSLDKALQLAPGNPAILCNLISNKMYLCDWRDIEIRSQQLVDTILRTGAAVDPFTFQGLPCAPGNAAQLACARANGAAIRAAIPQMELSDKQPAARAPRPAERKIRIGYLSMDFRAHPMAYLMTAILEKHDRSQFEIFAYAYGPVEDSPERQRFMQAVDHFIDIHELSDAEAADRIAADGIDILIDRKGYTFGHRLGIFARRPAPVQVNYLAFGGTMGVDFIDYAIVDAFVVPPEEQENYTERLVYLPDCYQPNSYRPKADKMPARSDCGLPEEAVVFCCFNQTYKLTPRIFDCWMRILQRVPDAVLWLLHPDAATADNLRHEAAIRGVDADRLIFAPKVPQADHIARHALVDIFLDTDVVNALTTASDALSMGCPVITCPGHSFVSRGAGSILRAMELPELIADDFHAYEDLAVMLGTQPDSRAALRKKIAEKMRTAPLFDTARYSAHLDRALQEMWRRYAAGQPAEPFSVPPLETSPRS